MMLDTRDDGRVINRGDYENKTKKILILTSSLEIIERRNSSKITISLI